MGRRRFVQTVSERGVASAPRPDLTREAFANTVDDTQREVVRIKGYRHLNHEEVLNGARPEREPVFYTIPRSRWVKVEAPQSALRGLLEKYGKPEYLGGGVTYRKPGYEGEPVISLGYHSRFAEGDSKSLGRLRDDLPETVTGTVTGDGQAFSVGDIPVTIGEVYWKDEAWFESRYRPVPAGCQGTSTSSITIGTPAYHSRANRSGWLTCGHCIDRDTNVDVYQPESDRIGHSIDYTESGNGDLGFVASDGPGGKPDFAAPGDNNYKGYDIWGSLAKDNLKDRAQSGDGIKIQGRNSGDVSKPIYAVYTKNTNDWVVFDEHYTEGGDSGGPYYTENDGDSYIAGIHKGAKWYDGAYRTGGNTAYYAERELPCLI